MQCTNLGKCLKQIRKFRDLNVNELAAALKLCREAVRTYRER